MITNTHVTKWTATDTKKDGTKLVGKFGPYWRVSIQAVEFEGWASGFVSGAERPEDWTNKEVNLELSDEEYQGKMQKKFKIPKQSSQEMAELDSKIEKILNNTTAIRLRVEVLAEFVLGKDAKKKDLGTTTYPTNSNKTEFDEPKDAIYDNSVEEPPF